MVIMIKNSLFQKAFFVSMFFLFINVDLFSQEPNPDNRFNIGFEGGYQYTNVYDSEAFTVLPKGKSGYNFGLFGDYKLGGSIKLGLGLYLDKRGFKSNDYLSPIGELQSDDSIYVSYASYYQTNLDYSLNYLTIPVSLIYYRESEKISIYLKASLYYSLLLSANKDGSTELYIFPDHAPNFEAEELRVPGSTITNFNNEDVFDDFNTDDWGVQLNIGLLYKLNDRIGIHFSPGLTLAFQQLYADPIRSSKWNNIYRVNVGFNYKLKN